MDKFKKQPWWVYAGLLSLLAGLILRFWHITANQFLFYDEGMYLGYNRKFLNLVTANPPKDIHEFFIILGLMFKTSLSTAKSLWFFLLNLRVFIVGPEGWYFARVISALSGFGTILLTYAFANRYFQSKKIGALSVIFLSLLPSHVFYSWLGMQESLSTLLFLAALYLYVFYKPFNYRVVICAVLLSCLYLTNYRMIIAPVFLIAIEVFEAFKDRAKINWVKWMVCTAIFGGIICFIGSLYGGINWYVNSGWMMNQAHEAQVKRDFISFFSFPYYTFALEGILFALIFWGNAYFVIQKKWSKLLPFLLVLLQMCIFSMAAEKGARYLCVVLPFMAIAAAVFAEFCLSFNNYKRYVLIGVTLACVWMGWESFKIVNSKTDYAQAIHLILDHDPNAKILSTQPLTEKLYISNENNIQECPNNLADLVEFYKQGYRYLVIDPQIYISWTKDEQRFSPPLIDFLEFINAHVPAIASFNHLNGTLLSRFVLDHNQHLIPSLQFLQGARQKGYGQIKIYDLEQCLIFLKNINL